MIFYGFIWMAGLLLIDWSFGDMFDYTKKT